MALDEIHNYYEDLVQQYIHALELEITRDADYINDLACLALNQLPAHYIRVSVDMAHFMTDEKRHEMEDRVVFAVTSAINWLDKEEHRRSRDD